MSPTRPAALAFLLVVLTVPASAAKIEKQVVKSGERDRRYYLLVPDGITKEQPAPLIVLLHGSGRDGRILVEKWKGLAEKSKIILAGPDATNPQFWGSPEDGPQMLYDLVEELKTRYPVDPRRVYLFGHSAGANFAVQMALVESQYFAAVALHAGALVPELYNLMSYAKRKIPVLVVVGTHDPLVPVDVVRASRAALEKGGFLAELTEIARHTHDYYSRSGPINERVWTFLSAHALPAEPYYKVYR